VNEVSVSDTLAIHSLYVKKFIYNTDSRIQTVNAYVKEVSVSDTLSINYLYVKINQHKG
jgi:hypothetical protein